MSELKPFLLSFRWTRQDNPTEYKLVYAQSEEEAKEKLRKWVAKHPYGETGMKAIALDVCCETIL